MHPETSESFAEVLAVLGERASSFIPSLWYRSQRPSRLAVPVVDPNPESLRLTINRGLVTLVEQLAIYPPGLALFADSYELDDDASAAVLESLVT